MHLFHVVGTKPSNGRARVLENRDNTTVVVVPCSYSVHLQYFLRPVTVARLRKVASLHTARGGTATSIGSVTQRSRVHSREAALPSRHLVLDKQCPVCKTPIDVMERSLRTRLNKDAERVVAL